MDKTSVALKTVAIYTKQHHLLPEKSTVVLGLSGGPDSMFLLHYLAPLHHQGSISLIACHLDHQWRTASQADAVFCQQVAQGLKIPFLSQQIEQLGCTMTYNGSKEELGRLYRRFFFEQVRAHYNADVIALGHHANDQHETFLIRLIRGASLTGLVGMRPKTGYYIRPLLCITKQDILAYLHEHKIEYLHDATNASNDFLRNRLRNTVIPALQEADPRFTITCSKSLEQLAKTENFLERHTDSLYATMLTEKLSLSLPLFRSLDEVIQYRIVVRWFHDYQIPFPVTDGFLSEVIKFLVSPQGGTHQIHPQWAIHKKQQQAAILHTAKARL